MEPGLLALAQRLSPGFPVGGFAYSHGLEWAIASGEVCDGASLADWLSALIEAGSGRCDAILVALAMRGDADTGALADAARALAAGRERLVETRDQGAAFASVLAALGEDADPGLPYPVAVGASSRGLGLDAQTVAAFYLQAFAANLVQVAVRFVPLGQSEGQRVLAALAPLILVVAADAAQAGLDDLGSGAFRSDLAAMRHETMEVRIFRT